MLAYLLNNPLPQLAATAFLASGLTYGGMSWRHQRHQRQQAHQAGRAQQLRLRWPLAGCGRVSDAQWQAGVRLLLKEAGMRAEYTTDRWGSRHYRLVACQPDQDTQPTLDTLATLTMARPAPDETPAREQEDEDNQLWPQPTTPPAAAAAN